MERFFIVALALGLALHPSAVGAAPLQPTKAWQLDYGETNCTASRDYGTGDKPLLLALRPSVNGKVLQILLMRPGGVSNAAHVPVAVKLPGTSLRTTGLRYENGKFEILRMNFDKAELEPIRGASIIEIEAKGAVDGSFAIPGIAKVAKAMEGCNLNLQAHWNIGEERKSRFTTFATSVRPLYTYLHSEDYPAQALLEHREGTVGITLMVDEKGVLQDCSVEETSGVAVLDAQTCIRLKKMARFRPAVDASGEPVRSVVTAKVRWALP
jgi:TonB family protein